MTDVLDRRITQVEPEPRPIERPSTKIRRPLDPSISARVLLAVLSAAAGMIHLAMVPSHWATSVVEGVGFAITGWLQLSLAFLLLWKPTTTLLRAVMVAEPRVHRDLGDQPDLRAAGRRGSVAPARRRLRRPRVRRYRGGAHRRGRRGAVPSGPRSRLEPGSGAHVRGRPAVGARARHRRWLASPSARDHASGSHGHDAAAGAMPGGHGHGAAASGDDKGLSALQNGHQHGGGEVPLDTRPRPP